MRLLMRRQEPRKRLGGVMGAENDAGAVLHLAPPKGTGLMPCCGKTPFEVPHADRMTVHRDQVTCHTEAGAARAALAQAWFDGYSKGNLDGYFGTSDERKASPYADLDPYREKAP